MGKEEYNGYEKVIKDSLVAARGKNLSGTKEEKIQELERKLETAKLSQTEIAEIQKQLKQLKAK